MNRKSLAVIIGVVLLIVFGTLLFLFQVRKTDVAVVTTFGRPTRPITEPGAYWKWPWPIQKVYKFDQRVQNFAEDKLTEGLTQDGFNLLTSVYVGWKITEVTNFFPKFAGSDEPLAEARRVLELVVANARASVVGKHPLGDFLSAAGAGNEFAEIENQILALVRQEVRTHNYGVDVEFLGIKKLGLPETVTQSVFDRMTSERQVLASRSQYEGEAEAEKIRSAADRKAAELLASADAQATEIRGKGEAEAAKSLLVFKQNPELASFIFRLNAMEGSLKDRSVLIFDQQTPPFDLFLGTSTNLLNK